MHEPARKIALMVTGFALLLLSVAGIVYSSRVWLAQELYFNSKFGSASGDPARILENCRRADALYPFNYRFCLLAAETAHDSAATLTGDEAKERLAVAEKWCRRGIVLNPYPRGFNWLMSEFLWPHSPEMAVDIWKKYVDWDFWSAYNHSVLASLYARIGDFPGAEKELAWTRNSEYYALTSQLIAEKKRDTAQKATPQPQGR